MYCLWAQLGPKSLHRSCLLMPAIQPARLRQQAALLVEQFDQPDAFIRSLHHLLDFYADRTHHPGQAGEPPPLLSAYNVRPPVLRQVLLELTPLAQENPDAALRLCDALWAQPYLEMHLLSAGLLGQLPIEPPVAVMDRVQAWAEQEKDARLITILFDQGMGRLRKESPQLVLQRVEKWLADTEPFIQQLGLRVLLPLAEDPDYQNLPVIFHLIYPLARSIPSGLRPELLDVLAALARRSPQETAYFLRQTWLAIQSPDTAWLIRQSLPAFPTNIQESLRRALRETSN